MRPRPRRLLVVALIAFAPVAAQMEQAAPPRAARTIQLDDIINWKAVGANALSNDGQWFAYRIAAIEGDGQLVVRRTRADKELKFDLGETPEGGGRGGGRGGAIDGGGASATLAFSDDSKWIAFTTYPSRAEQQRLRRQRRPVNSSVSV